MKQVYGLINEHSLDIGSKSVGTWLSNYTNYQWGVSEAKSIQQSLVNTCASIGRIFFVQKDDEDERWFASCVRIHSEYIITCTPMNLENYVTSKNLKMYAIFSFNGKSLPLSPGALSRLSNNSRFSSNHGIALILCFYAIPDGKPVPTFPGIAL